MRERILVINIFKGCARVNEPNCGLLLAIFPVEVRGCSLVKYAAFLGRRGRFHVVFAGMLRQQFGGLPRMKKATRHMGLEIIAR